MKNSLTKNWDNGLYIKEFLVEIGLVAVLSLLVFILPFGFFFAILVLFYFLSRSSKN
jgi:hypothetical protein